MTVSAWVRHDVDPSKILTVTPLGDHDCQMTFVDADGHELGGYVACRAEALRQIMAAEADRIADDALRACTESD